MFKEFFSIGPHRSETTASSLQFWARGHELPSKQCYPLELRKQNQLIETKEICFLPHQDFTGVITFFNLEAGSSYQLCYQGQIILTAETFASKPNETRFLLGSCRHFELGAKSTEFGEDCDHDDYAFRDMIGKMDSKKIAPHFIMMTGDQVYADHPKRSIYKSFKDHLIPLDHFWDHYREGWNKKYFSKLLTKIPSYFCMDDHEIQNDWGAHKYREHNKKFNPTTLKNGLFAYQVYQGINNPDSKLEHFWYQFSHGHSDFFVMDIRSERTLTHMISQEQEEALKAWLKNSPEEQVKFITSSVPFFPQARTWWQGLSLRYPQNFFAPAAPYDKWDGWSDQRHRLLEFIRLEKIKKVVFLSGDIHCSMATYLTHESDPDFKVYSIISSAFNWPIIGLNRDHFEMDKPLPTTVHLKKKKRKIDFDQRGPYQAHFVSNSEKVHLEQNYAYLLCDEKKIELSYYASSGDLLENLHLNLS